MDMPAIINQMIVLFIMLAAGFAAGKAKLLTEDGVKALSKLILYITVPCTVLGSVIDGGLETAGGETLFFALISLSALILSLIISIPAIWALGGDKKTRGLYRYMAVFGNCANMGFPVTIAILGAVSAFYVAVYNIPYILLCYSVGVFLVSGKTEKFDFRILLNPSLIAGVIVILIITTGFKAPAIIADTVKLLSSITTPGSMLIIGASLSRISFRDTFKNWRLYPVMLLKLIIMPVVTWLVFKPFVADPMMLSVLVIMSSMASGTMSAIFAIEYGGDERVASSGIFISTLLSGVTIPLIVYLFLM